LPSITANGIQIEYQETGARDAPAILLIMGLGTQLVGWPDSLCNDLAAQGYRVIRYDNRDVGLTTRTAALTPAEIAARCMQAVSGKPVEAPYDLDDMAADALGLLDALGVARAHVVGISMGGMIAQILAADHPERVASLLLLMTHSGNRNLPPGRPEALAALFAPRPDGSDREAAVAHTMRTYRVIGSPAYRMSDADLRAWVERSVDRAYHPLGAGLQLLAVLASPDRVARCRRIRVPTLVMHGIDDPLVPVECGKELAAIIPGARLQLVPGMGHDLAEGLMPLWADAIAGHCRVADAAAETA
jgi:pimeloyl-ACP methyl ester carboxylesterase